MSDISIPGVSGTNKAQNDKIIDELMRVERIPLDRKEETLSGLEGQKRVWQDLNRGLTRLREVSRQLFGFQNPFNERVAHSSDEGSITATATREAIEGSSDLEVKQIASRDRFLSRALEREYQPPQGSYAFSVGERRVQFPFRGGNLEKLAETISDRGGGIVTARVIRDSSTSNVIVIESMESGAANTLNFEESALDFATEAGILKRADDASQTFPITDTTIRRWEKPLTGELVQVSEGRVVLRPGGEVSLPALPPVSSKERLLLEVQLEITALPYEYVQPEPPPGPAVPGAGSITFQDIEIQSEASKPLLPEWELPEPPVRTDNLRVVYIEGDGESIPLAVLKDQEGAQKLEIPLIQYADQLTAVRFRNENTHREITVVGVRVFDPESRGDYRPMNPIETAGDAQLLIDGIEVTRNSNTIDDLLPGVTLNLNSPTTKPVELNIEPDREAVKEAIIGYVGGYNRLLADINIVTNVSEEVIEEITYFQDQERETARERLGLLQGNITLMQLKSRLQNIMMNPYPTRLGSQLTLLDQIGISTNAARSEAGGVDRSRLRGYLEIDEESLNRALETSLPEIKELFGSDTDGDLIVDTGAAIAVDRYIKPYVETGGFVSQRITNIDRSITRTNRDIESLQVDLERKEADYRREYAVMEGALNTLETSSQQIDNFSRSLERER